MRASANAILDGMCCYLLTVAVYCEPRPVLLIVYTGHVMRRHFDSMTARGLGRRTLKTITHH